MGAMPGIRVRSARRIERKPATRSTDPGPDSAKLANEITAAAQSRTGPLHLNNPERAQSWGARVAEPEAETAA